MTVYSTCRNCALARVSCERRAAVKTGLAGLSITSVKFKCADRKPVLHRGQRIEVTWPVPDEDSDDGYTLETFKATVIRESGARFLVKVDDADSDFGTPARGYIKNESLFARPAMSAIIPIDEPDVAICGMCDSPDVRDCFQPEHCERAKAAMLVIGGQP